MSDALLTYALGEGIIAFTSDRTIGREPELLKKAVSLTDGRCCEDTLRFARPHQTHTDRIMPVAEEYFTLPPQIQTMLMEGKDAVITDVANTILGVSTADCIPVIVYDAEHHAAAAIHAGWRGTVQRIVLKTMMQMAQTYHTNPAHCTAAIGPGISLESFEIGDEVYDAFVKAGLDMSHTARRYPNSNAVADAAQQTEKWHIDLKEVNRQQLLTAGIPGENITVSPIDTFTDTRFFSARREQKGDIKCGRIFTGFVMP